MSDDSPGVLARVGGGITRTRNFVVNTVFIAFLVVIAVGLLAQCQSVAVPNDSALLINPKGAIVEAATLPDPFSELLSAGPRVGQVELSALLSAIEFAAHDDDIRMIILDLDELAWAAPAHAQRLGVALAAFRETGKKVVSYGHFYSQAQYHIASFADALYMHPMGQVVFEGFGGFNFYFNELLEKFDVNVHVFRVGSYKSAVEPLTRNDMSEDARIASEALYQNIWQHLVQDVATNRQVSKASIQDYADNLADALAVTQGDLARAALEAHLVDELLTTDQAQVRMAAEVGYRETNTGDLNSIDLQSYLAARKLLQPTLAMGKDKVAVIVAQGMIMSQSNDDQVVGADTTISLIRQAKEDPSIKAVVLRVDSPGGSQFASELIRQELELVQLAGKPVIASFGASAASGGYWIAATSDAIVAEPTTVTGSIGIFSYLTTFEDALANYGVHTDGVGTTSLTMGMNPFTGINDSMAKIMQARVEHGYEQFINLVARGRNLTVAEVEEVAQGRVWSGEVALELGLVDQLGGLQSALEKAAQEAELDEWTSVTLRRPVDPRAALIAELLGDAQALSTNATRGLAGGLAGKLQNVLRVLERFDDPLDTYALCMGCGSDRYWMAY